MRQARYLRSTLRMLGYRLRVAGDELQVAPISTLSPELRDSIRLHRVLLLADARNNPDPPIHCIDCGATLPAPLKWRCPACLAMLEETTRHA